MDLIRVHVQIHGTYLPVLSIPVVECHRFSLKPLKWLRFLGYTIYGQEGHISLSPGGDSVDYKSAIEGGADYFYVSSLPPRLLDTRCINHGISDADTTESRAGFREDLVDRDGCCIVTNLEPLFCKACHYYPHSKGSKYIQQLMHNRGEGDIDIDDTNDRRVGLLLSNLLCTIFGIGDVAFLKTPNFALSNDDIPPSPGPIRGTPSASPGRFIFQHFKQHDDENRFLSFLAPHNQDARQPADMTMFPPPVVTDMFYGCAAVMQWGIKESTEAVWSLVRSLYYNDVTSGSEDSQGRDNSKGGDDMQGKYPPEKKETPWSLRGKKRADRNNEASLLRASRKRMEETMDLVMLLWAQSRPAQNGRQSLTEIQLGQDKVTSWLQAQ